MFVASGFAHRYTIYPTIPVFVPHFALDVLEHIACEFLSTVSKCCDLAALSVLSRTGASGNGIGACHLLYASTNIVLSTGVGCRQDLDVEIPEDCGLTFFTTVYLVLLTATTLGLGDIFPSDDVARCA